MSLRSPVKTRAPAHQNAFKYKHNKNSRKTKEIMAAPIEGVCEKCYSIAEWRKDYRKYKPLTVPKKCVMCEQKKVVRSYTIICADCATKHNLCAKCKQPKPIVKEFDSAKKEAEEEAEKERILASLRERDRRRYLMHLERGDLDSDSDEEDEEEEGAEEEKDEKKTRPEKKEKKAEPTAAGNKEEEKEEEDEDDEDMDEGDEEEVLEVENEEDLKARQEAQEALKNFVLGAAGAGGAEGNPDDIDSDEFDDDEDEDEDEEDNPFLSALKVPRAADIPLTIAPEVEKFKQKYEAKAKELKAAPKVGEEEAVAEVDEAVDVDSEEEEKRFLDLQKSNQPPVKSFVFASLK